MCESAKLSNRPSVATITMSPTCSWNLSSLQSPTLSLRIPPSASPGTGGGSMASWNGVLKKCCCMAVLWTMEPLLTTRQPLSPRLAEYRVFASRSSTTMHTVLLPMMGCLRSCIASYPPERMEVGLCTWKLPSLTTRSHCFMRWRGNTLASTP